VSRGFAIDLKGSTHHLGSLKVLTLGPRRWAGGRRRAAVAVGRGVAAMAAGCALNGGLGVASAQFERGGSGLALRGCLAEELRESLGRRVPVERLSWSIVELGCDGIEVLLGE
jgi:hypothetical protein